MKELPELKSVVFQQMRGPVGKAIEIVSAGTAQVTVGKLLNYICDNLDPDILDRWTVNANACCLSCLLTEFLETFYQEEAAVPTYPGAPPIHQWPASAWTPPASFGGGWGGNQPS